MGDRGNRNSFQSLVDSIVLMCYSACWAFFARVVFWYESSTSMLYSLNTSTRVLWSGKGIGFGEARLSPGVIHHLSAIPAPIIAAILYKFADSLFKASCYVFIFHGGLSFRL
jgi:hypothetical protein